MLDDTDLSAPSILAGIPHLSSEELARQEEQIARAWRRLLPGQVPGQPQLVSLRQADVAGLGLSNISAADCRFAGAHNLDKLRLESGISFAAAPPPAGSDRGWQWRGGREVIAEERAWRAGRHGRRWAAPAWPGWLGDQQPDVLDPGQIASLCRALRKAREDDKDEPGAADFYYGEMEMRRARPRRGHGGQSGAASRGRVERGILTAYWLVSGYSLRAWRAVAWLAVITALFAAAFHLVGFAVPPRPVSYWTSLLYAFRATLSLADNQVTLTAWGSLLQAVLRLTGPVLLGLALLALRGRVKRRATQRATGAQPATSACRTLSPHLQPSHSVVRPRCPSRVERAPGAADLARCVVLRTGPSFAHTGRLWTAAHSLTGWSCRHAWLWPGSCAGSDAHWCSRAGCARLSRARPPRRTPGRETACAWPWTARKRRR